MGLTYSMGFIMGAPRPENNELFFCSREKVV